jgi:hypothetical protein
MGRDPALENWNWKQALTGQHVIYNTGCTNMTEACMEADAITKNSTI